MTSLLLLALIGQFEFFDDDPVIVSSCPLIDANCESRPVATARASSAWWVQTDGGVSTAANGVGRYDPDRGLLSYAGETNELANTAALDLWTKLGAIGDGGVASTMEPTVTANSTDVLDPMQGNAAEKIVFPATVWENDASFIYSSFQATAVAWDGSLYFRTASGTATLYLWPVDRTIAQTIPGHAPTETTCAVTTAWAPCEWTATLNLGGWFYALGIDLRNSATTNQTAKPAMTVYAWGAKAVLGAVAGPPIICGASACSTLVDTSTMPSAGLPTTSGRVTLTYTPMHTVALARCLLDTIASNNGVRLCLDASDQLVLTLGNGTATTATTSAAQTWTGGTSYALEVEWGNGNAFVRKAGTLVASTVDGTAKVPTAHAANLAYGNLIAGTSPVNGYVSKPSWEQR